ncbi:hypothetical protein EON64_00965 [archaeon]|nr:MAG: hypothetical protein EON64_00965 [archaeon]
MMQDIVTENRRLLLTQLRAVEKENVELKKKLKELEEQKKKLSKGDSDGWTLVPYEAPPNAGMTCGTYCISSLILTPDLLIDL